MRRWLLGPAAAPIGGLVAGVAVFVGVLGATPPGVAAPYLVLVTPVQNPVGESSAYAAAYATGAASALGVIALGLVAAVLALARSIALAGARRSTEAAPPD